MVARKKKDAIAQETITLDDSIVAICSDDIAINTIVDELEIADFAEPMITLEATLTIQNVAALHEKLKKAYSANNVMEINASQVTSIDTATLQLLVVLKKDAVKQQKEVVFAMPSLRFIESAGLLGLLEILDIDA
jgi:anti-anti-sigma regulatory factor